MATVTVTVEKIGVEDFNLGSGTWNRTTSVGGTQAMTKVSVPTIEAGISDVSSADLIKLHAITATAAQIDNICAGHMLRVVKVAFNGNAGTSDDVVITSLLNGDEVTGTVLDTDTYYTFATSGNALAVLALSVINFQVSKTTFVVTPTIVSNNIRLQLQDTSDGTTMTFQELLADNVAYTLEFILTYITSA